MFYTVKSVTKKYIAYINDTMPRIAPTVAVSTARILKIFFIYTLLYIVAINHRIVAMPMIDAMMRIASAVLFSILAVSLWFGR